MTPTPEKRSLEFRGETLVSLEVDEGERHGQARTGRWLRAIPSQPPKLGRHATIIDHLVTQRVIPSLVAESDRWPAGGLASPPEALALLAARGNDRALHAALADELQKGHPIEEVLGTTAAALGSFWEEDELNFSEVTMATARLQRWHRAKATALPPLIGTVPRIAYCWPRSQESSTAWGSRWLLALSM